MQPGLGPGLAPRAAPTFPYLFFSLSAVIVAAAVGDAENLGLGLVEAAAAAFACGSRGLPEARECVKDPKCSQVPSASRSQVAACGQAG